ncbi:hypothetical protein [Mycoplasma simbae]|uniref:hypothetical protein n=1 Tax=Mycoplasma simbae TaxID=36744 RepID=UPI00068A4197|nr:hypothetical protein [Mycoplasma simbae]
MDIKFIYKVTNVHWILFSLLSIVLASLSWLIPSLIFGYVIGASVSYLLFELRILLSTKILTSKQSAYAYSMLNWVLALTLVSLVLALIFAINYFALGFDHIVSGPVNVFSFSFALINVKVAIILAHLWKNKRKEAHGSIR